MFSVKWLGAKLREKGVRKWLIVAVAVAAAVVAAQIYYVQEIAAALLLFTVGFALVGGVLLLLFLLDRGSQHALTWLKPRTVRAARAARHGLAVAGEISKKQLHRPRSQTVR